MENFTFETSTRQYSVEPLLFTIPSEVQKLSALYDLDHHMTKLVLPVSIITAIGTVVGFVGNAGVIYVYMFHYKPCSFRIFVLWLGVVDLLSTMIPMTGEVITQTHWYTYPSAVICKIKSIGNVFTVSAEAMTLLAITFDRYLKACRPLGRQMSNKTAKLIVICIFLIAIVFSVPIPFYWGTHTENIVHKNINITVTICERERKFINRTEHVNYSYVMQGIMCLLMAIMSVLCLLIIRTLIVRSGPTAQNAKRQQAPKVRVTRASKMCKGNIDNQETMDTSVDISIKATSDTDQSDHSSNTRLVFLKMNTTPDENISTDSGNIDSMLKVTRNKVSPQERSKEKRYNKKSNTIKININTKTIKRVRSKTIIIFVLTITFIITTVLYLIMASYMSKGILKTLTDAQKTIFFVFLRLNFVNHVINPIVYGALDPRFKAFVTVCWRTKIGRFYQNT